MLRMLLFVPLLFIGACVAGGPPAETTTETEEALSSSGTPAVGTFRARTGREDHFARLVLKTDGTYHADKLARCDTAPCPYRSEEGTYSFEGRAAGTYLVLEQPGRDMEAYRYRHRGDIVAVQGLSEDSPWQSLRRPTLAWCEVPEDCGLQGLTPGSCGGSWTCERNACSYACGRLQPLP